MNESKLLATPTSTGLKGGGAALGVVISDMVHVAALLECASCADMSCATEIGVSSNGVLLATVAGPPVACRPIMLEGSNMIKSSRKYVEG